MPPPHSSDEPSADAERDVGSPRPELSEPVDRPDEFVNTRELIPRAQAGDRTAYETLFARYYPRVLRIARLRMSNKLRSRVESQEIVARVFQDAVRNFDRFELRHDAAFIAWLSQMAENAIRNAAKGVNIDDGRAGPLKGDDEEPDGPRIPDESEPKPGERLETAELEDALDDCVRQLSDTSRDVIELRNYLSTSWEHIAAQLGVDVGAAQTRHWRARKELRGCMKRKGYDIDDG